MGNKFRRTFALVLLTTVLALTGCAKKPAEETPSKANGLKIDYAEGVTVVEDPNALQKAVDDMIEKSSQTVGLEYKSEAFSSDGLNFSCYIANALRNQHDMFIAIYGDIEMTDELFLSGLLRPGSAFDNIKLNHALEPGTHTVYVIFTQVDEVDGEQAIHAQVTVTMDFIVNVNG